MKTEAKIIQTELKLVALGRVLDEQKAQLEQLKNKPASTAPVRRNLKQKRIEQFALFYTKRAINKQLKKAI